MHYSGWGRNIFSGRGLTKAHKKHSSCLHKSWPRQLPPTQGDSQSAWEAPHPHLSLVEHQGDPEPLCNAMKAGLGFFAHWESRLSFSAPNSAQMIKWLQELFKKSTSSQCCQKCSTGCRFWPIWWSQQHQQRNINSQELQSVTLCHSSPQRCSVQKSIQLHTMLYCNQHHFTRKIPSISNVFCPRN